MDAKAEHRIDWSATPIFETLAMEMKYNAAETIGRDSVESNPPPSHGSSSHDAETAISPHAEADQATETSA
ncbi:hypothetical protein GCM10009565_52770 [Amycolatopsis albidoflavus]